MGGEQNRAFHIDAFRDLIYDYYRSHGRVLPWRLTQDPYCILVSEIMLQQTQVDRVLGKYGPFIETFPDFPSLAVAPVESVLRNWQGLGYNRRALALKKTAVRVVDEFQGRLPDDPGVLVTLSGIGTATASSIAAFAFNMPVVFIETNIRTVFIHFFFEGQEFVTDSEILPLVEESLDADNPKDWYYALMDYGSMLKKAGDRGHRRSGSYRKQSTFYGSDRQVRGAILRLLLAEKTLSTDALTDRSGQPEEKVLRILSELEKEGFVLVSDGSVAIT
jgi:A/G-specific adenine glycosylase